MNVAKKKAPRLVKSFIGEITIIWHEYRIYCSTYSIIRHKYIKQFGDCTKIDPSIRQKLQ